MKRHIRKVGVLGSGVMGSAIACHCANAGFQVLLLDIPAEEGKGSRNAIVDQQLAKCIQSRPAPLYRSSWASRIETGNLEDDLHRLKSCDWIIEVVIERADIKQQLYEKIEAIRTPGTLITTNTSGIPIHVLAAGRSEDFVQHFCGTHFFNPPRYLPLLEVIPGPKTKPEVIQWFKGFGHRFLGKTVVECKDTPAFIANRVGVFAMAKVMECAGNLGLSISDVDILTGPTIARPKTGTFRLADLVGLDVAYKVITDLKKYCVHDTHLQKLTIPPHFEHVIQQKWYGNKSGQGYYKKTKVGGESQVLALNLSTCDYETPAKAPLPSKEISKQIENPVQRIQAVFDAPDAGGELLRQTFASLFSYVSWKIPEISDTITDIDQAMKAGFGWTYGPFETWDMIGMDKVVATCAKYQETLAPWVTKFRESGNSKFYLQEQGASKCYHPLHEAYEEIHQPVPIIHLDTYREKKPVYQNADCTCHDIGDGVLCLEWHSKMNTIGEGVIKGVNESIRIAEEEGWNGIVIGNHAPNFSVGANLMLVAMLAYQQEWDQLHHAVTQFQNTSMRLRYSAIPVVMATQGYVFGGSCEMAMHTDSVVAAAESYIGLVEVGVGLLPGGAGTKEFALKTAHSFQEGDVQMNHLIHHFSTIAKGEVSTSAYEAFDKKYLSTKDRVTLHKDSNIQDAKKQVLALSDRYVQPIEHQDILVLGKSGIATLELATHSFLLGHYISEHDQKIAKKIAWVMCGGDLSGQQMVSERYLLDLEKEAFLSLCGEQKTLERIQHMLKTGKALRN